MTGEWWLCPNEPRCPHGAILHDIYDYEDTSPRCCADGCDCGRTDAPSPGMMSGYPSITDEP